MIGLLRVGTVRTFVNNRFTVEYTTLLSIQNSAVFFATFRWAYPVIHPRMIVNVLSVTSEIKTVHRHRRASAVQIDAYVVADQRTGDIKCAVIQASAISDAGGQFVGLNVVPGSDLQTTIGHDSACFDV